MAKMNGYVLTNAGKALLAKVRTGLRLSFTRVAFGDGKAATGTDIKTLTAMVSQKQTFPIYDIETTADNVTILSVVMTNVGLATGYDINEIGLIAQDPENSSEVLYAYCTAEEPDFMAAAGPNTMVSNVFKIHIVEDDAANISVTLDMDAYATKNYVLNHTYPVGSIFISTVATSPATLIGGTWQQLPEGKMLLSAGDNYKAGSTGGAATHKLTINELPAHEHDLQINLAGKHNHYSIDGFSETGWDTTNGGLGGDGYPLRIAYGDNRPWRDNIRGATTSINGDHNHTGKARSTGGGQEFSIMPPYISVYMWQRTA